MSIKEYKSYCDAYIQKQVDEYVKKSYNNGKYILCWFNLYSVDIEKLRCPKDWIGKTTLKRDTYTTLLSLLLRHPEITFQELPRYIPLQLYEDLLFYLCLPTTKHPIYPDRPGSRSMPIAVEMKTLQRDAKEIAGDEPYSFGISSNTPEFEFEAICVSIWKLYKKSPLIRQYLIDRKQTKTTNVTKL